MHIAKKIAFALVVIGGLNWGIYGVSGANMIHLLAGSLPMIESIIYVLVGLSSLFLLFKRHTTCCCSCEDCEHGTHCEECMSKDDAKTETAPTL